MNIVLQKQVYSVVQRIPVGRVATYGWVANKAGIKNPRLVGTYLHKNPDPKTIPCHRVVNATGVCSAFYAFGGKKKQEEKLQREGIDIQNHHIDLQRFGMKHV